MDIKVEPDDNNADFKLTSYPINTEPYNTDNIYQMQDVLSNQQIFIKQEVMIEYVNGEDAQNNLVSEAEFPVIKSELNFDLQEAVNCDIPLIKKSTNARTSLSKRRPQKICDEFTVEENIIKVENLDSQEIPLVKVQRVYNFKSYFVCGICDFYCDTVKFLKKHKKVHGKMYPLTAKYRRLIQNNAHSQLLLEPLAKEIFFCDICTYKFKSKHNLIRHNLIHSGEKPYVCNVCNFKFNRKSNLKEHMVIHSGSKPFSCNECDYKCFKKSSLTNHKYIHSGEKPYSCKLCTHKSKSKGHFDRHVLTHTKEKPYVCHLCPKKFKIKSNLKHHILIHSGIKTVSCPKCYYKCYTKSNLKCHEAVHANENNFDCKTSDSKFDKANDLKEHKILHKDFDHEHKLDHNEHNLGDINQDRTLIHGDTNHEDDIFNSSIDKKQEDCLNHSNIKEDLHIKQNGNSIHTEKKRGHNIIHSDIAT